MDRPTGFASPWAGRVVPAPRLGERPTRPVSGDWPRPYAWLGMDATFEVLHHGHENLVNRVAVPI